MRKKEKNENLIKIEKLIKAQIKQANQIQSKKMSQMKDTFKELVTHLER